MHDKEELLWERVKMEDRKRPGETIRVAKIGKHLGIHEEKSRDWARKWKNSGYCTFSTADYIRLTKKGQAADLPEEDD